MNLVNNYFLESDDFQLYFGLPYIPKPHTKSQFAHIFTPEFSKKILTKLLRFLKSASLSLHDAQTVQRQKQVFDQLTRKSRKQESEIRKLEGKFITAQDGPRTGIVVLFGPWIPGSNLSYFYLE